MWGLTSGIKVRDIELGSGAVADRTKVAVVDVRAFLNRGEEFWNTHPEGRPAILDLSQRHSLPGLIMGIEGMRAGGKRELVVSPHLAYGATGVPGKIPPNAVIHFEVELREVRERGAPCPELLPPGRQLLVFQPGEQARNLARWQFGLWEGQTVGGVFITHPVPGATWRNALQRSIDLTLSREKVQGLFQSVQSTLAEHPTDCLQNDQMWADASEKANSVTRDQATNALCITVTIYERGVSILHYGLPETSPGLLNSGFYQIISSTLEPHLMTVANEVKASCEARRRSVGRRLP